jgi:hypothetical protein
LDEDKDRYVTEEDILAAKMTCLELWNLEDPDVVEGYHAWQIIQIRLGKDGPFSFDDFVTSWKKYSPK